MNLSVGNRCSVRSGGIPFDLRWTLLVCPSFVTRDMLWSSASLLLSVAVAWESLQYCRMREVTTSWRTTAGSNSGMIFQRFVDGIMPGHDQGCLERSLFGEGSWNCPALTCPSPFHALPEMCATCRSSSDPVRTQTSQSPVALSPAQRFCEVFSVQGGCRDFTHFRPSAPQWADSGPGLQTKPGKDF